jgi:peptide subunit release factor 1 (eRF1)
MTQLDGTLSELARVRSGSEPIVSLYLDTRWNDEQQRQRVRLFVQEGIRRLLGRYGEGTPGREGLARSLERLRRHVAGLTSQEYEAERRGLALFACEALGLWRVLSFARPFRPELCADGFPHLTQLARLADDHEPVIVVAPSPRGADLFQVSLGDLGAETRIRGFVPRRDADEYNPGPAQHGQEYERVEKDERHQEAFELRNRRAAVQQLAAIHDRSPDSHLVLVGTSEAIAAFERDLPERLRARVIARIPRPRAWDRGDSGMRSAGAADGAAAALAARERDEERRIIDAVVGQSLRGGLAVMGPNDVVEALNQKRVHELVLEEDFALTGWRCDRCDAIGANAEAADTCPYCGGDLKVLQHLGEALVARAVAAGAAVEIVAHANKLHSYRGVGAFLRQTAQGALRGASGPASWAPGASQP